MFRYISGFLLILCLALVPGPAFAGKVQVFQPLKEGVTPMQLRQQAMDEGYALAVVAEAEQMLNGSLDKERLELLKHYLVGRSEPYVRGYKILSSQDFEDGLSLNLDVRVDNTALREGLTRMGLFTTAHGLLPASVTLPGDLTDEELAQVHNMEGLTNIQAQEGATPSFTLERGREKDTWKARLDYDGHDWFSVKRDLPDVWFAVWSQYFAAVQPKHEAGTGPVLAVGGWFSPDGVLEFDRVLRGWDSVVQDVKLQNMDMQSTGVSATWTLQILDRKRLSTLLNAYLPQRGLGFQFLGPDSE